MSDVNALIGKLKANVAYRQFTAPGREVSANWPVLERIARAQQGDAGPAAADALEPVEAVVPEPVVPEPLAPPAMVQAVEPDQPAVVAPSLIRRIKAASPLLSAAVAPEPEPEPEPVAATPPSDDLERLAHPVPHPVEVRAQPVKPQPAALSGGSLLRRYAPAPEPSAPAEPATDSRSLSDIFARLGGATR